jgi:hypothetical protein
LTQGARKLRPFFEFGRSVNLSGGLQDESRGQEDFPKDWLIKKIIDYKINTVVSLGFSWVDISVIENSDV